MPPPSMLNVVSVVEAPSPFAMHVCSDDVKDVAADTTNKTGDHANIIIDTNAVEEEKLHKDGNKAVDSDGTSHLAEGVAD